MHDPGFHKIVQLKEKGGVSLETPICRACMVQEAMRLRDAFKAMTGGCQGAVTVEGIIDV